MRIRVELDGILLKNFTLNSVSHFNERDVIFINGTCYQIRTMWHEVENNIDSVQDNNYVFVIAVKVV